MPRIALDTLSVGEKILDKYVRLCCVQGCFEDSLFLLSTASQMCVAVCALCHMVICLVKMLSVEAQPGNSMSESMGCVMLNMRINACLVSDP